MTGRRPEQPLGTVRCYGRNAVVCGRFERKRTAVYLDKPHLPLVS